MNKTIGKFICRLSGHHRVVERYRVVDDKDSGMSLVCERCGVVVMSFREINELARKLGDLATAVRKINDR